MDDIRLKALVALLKVSDEIIIPFFEFGPDHPVIGDKVNVNRYFDYNFTYKIDKVPYGCILTKDEILSTNWICTKIHYNDHHITESFTSVDKINGKKRTIHFNDCNNLKFEVVDMPERALLILDFKRGKYSLIELLKIFREKNYNSTITIRSIGFSVSGNDYLEAMEVINNEKRN